MILATFSSCFLLLLLLLTVLKPIEKMLVATFSSCFLQILLHAAAEGRKSIKIAAQKLPNVTSETHRKR